MSNNEAGEPFWPSDAATEEFWRTRQAQINDDFVYAIDSAALELMDIGITLKEVPVVHLWQQFVGACLNAEEQRKRCYESISDLYRNHFGNPAEFFSKLQATLSFAAAHDIHATTEQRTAILRELKRASVVLRTLQLKSAILGLDDADRAAAEMPQGPAWLPGAKVPIPAAESWPEYMSARDLAERLKLPMEATRKKLDRHADKYDDCYIENDSPRKGESSKLFRVADVLNFLLRS